MLWFTSQRMQKLCLTVRLKGGLLTILIFSYFGEARIFQTEARQKHNTVNYSTIMVPATDCCWIFLNNPFFLGVDIIAPSLHGTQEHLWRTLGWELIIVQQLWTTNYKMIHTSHQKMRNALKIRILRWNFLTAWGATTAKKKSACRNENIKEVDWISTCGRENVNVPEKELCYHSAQMIENSSALQEIWPLVMINTAEVASW